MSLFKRLGGASVEKEAPHPQDRPPDLDALQLDARTYDPGIDHIPGARSCSQNLGLAPKTRSFDFSAIYSSMSRRAIVEHDPDPSNMRINVIVIETVNNLDFDQIMSKQELELYTAYIRTMYKRKD